MADGQSIRAGRAFVELFADNDQLQRDLKRAEARVRRFGSRVSEIGNRVARAGTALAAPIAAATTQFARAGAQTERVARRLDTTVESLSALQFAAGQTGVEVERMQEALQEMSLRLGEAAQGEGEAAEALKRLNLNAKELNSLSIDQAFARISEAIADLNANQRNFAIDQIFGGDSGRELTNLILRGADGIQKLTNRARELGLVMSNSSAEAARTLNQRFAELTGSLSRTSKVIGGALAPQLSEILQRLSRATLNVAAWLQENQDAVVATARWTGRLLAGAAALKGIGVAATTAASAIGALRKVITATAALRIATGLTGLTFIFTGLALAISDTTSALDEMSEAQRNQLEQSDRQRAADQRRLAQLKQLNEQQSLHEVQLNEAASIINTLEDRYGDLGLSVDKATGSIEGMANAQERLNKAQREAAVRQTRQALSEARANFREAEKARTEIQSGTRDVPNAVGALISSVQQSVNAVTPFDFQTVIEQRAATRNQALSRITDLRRRLSELRGGSDDALTGDADGRNGTPGSGGGAGAGASGGSGGGGSESARQQRILEKRRELERRIAELRIRKAKEGIDRELALIDLRYDRERERIKEIEDIEQSKRDALLDQLGIARCLAKERARAQAASGGDAENQRRQQRIEEANRRRRQQIRRLEIRANNQGIEEERKLLELPEKQAVREARRNNENVKLVRREFELRRRLLDQQQQGGASGGVTGGSLATFGTRALDRRIGGPQQRIEDNTEQAANELRRIRRDIEAGEGGNVFG